MNQIVCHARAGALAVLVGMTPTSMKAQTNDSDAARWLAKAELAPAFSAPASRDAWEKERQQVRRQLWELLGQLPPRPKRPRVETLSREERADCVVERFQFDNGAGATVPGYVILPKVATGKLPALLYCHWHGGEYAIGKEELFQARHTPEAPGPALAKRGYVVVGIDAYCFGERDGHGPAVRPRKGARANGRRANSICGWGARSGA